MNIVSQPVRKLDAMQLVTGQPVYAEDVAPENCLVVKLLRSPHANAVVRPEEPISGILGALLEVFSDVPPPQTAPSATPYTDSRATISAAAAKAAAEIPATTT